MVGAAKKPNELMDPNTIANTKLRRAINEVHLRREDLDPLNHMTKRQCSERVATTRLATTTIKRLLNGRRRFVDGLGVVLAQASVREVTEAARKCVTEMA